MLETRNYVVGEANAASGLYRRTGESWGHVGWKNLRCTALAADSGTLFLASGNGVLRSRDDGASWRVTTDWRICEVLDLALDPHTASRILAASAHGVWHSLDEGETWTSLSTPGSRPDATFTSALVVDARRRGRIVTGTEDGLFESQMALRVSTSSLEGGAPPHLGGVEGVRVGNNVGLWRQKRAVRSDPTPPPAAREPPQGGGQTVKAQTSALSQSGGYEWRALGPRVAVRALAQSAADPTLWLAGTAEHGVLLSTDNGATWSARAAGTLYAVAIDPSDARRLAAAGYGADLWISTDGGQRWDRRALDVSAPAVHALAFGPDGRLWIGTVGDGVFVTDDLGATCRDAGLPETTVYDLSFA